MQQRSLTLAQRAVLVCIRDAGFPALADCAGSCWLLGKPCELPVAIGDPVLLDQFERLNGQPVHRA